MDEIPVEFLLSELKSFYEKHFPDVVLSNGHGGKQHYGSFNCSHLKMGVMFDVAVNEEIITVICCGYGIFVNRHARYGFETRQFQLCDPECFEKSVQWMNNKIAIADAEIAKRGIFTCGLIAAKKSLMKSLDES